VISRRLKGGRLFIEARRAKRLSAVETESKFRFEARKKYLSITSAPRHVPQHVMRVCWGSCTFTRGHTE